MSTVSTRLILVTSAILLLALAGMWRRSRGGRSGSHANHSGAGGKQPITLVVARARNGVIGRGGTLPWHLPADLKRFKALTTGTVMIMGRKTFDSLPGLLPGREHVVLTRSSDWREDGATVVHTVDEALAAAGERPISVIGGAEIFALFLPLATSIELTEVLDEIDGDTFMPDPRDGGDWREVACDQQAAKNGRPAFAFVTLERA